MYTHVFKRTQKEIHLQILGSARGFDQFITSQIFSYTYSQPDLVEGGRGGGVRERPGGGVTVNGRSRLEVEQRRLARHLPGKLRRIRHIYVQHTDNRECIVQVWLKICRRSNPIQSFQLRNLSDGSVRTTAH